MTEKKEELTRRLQELEESIDGLKRGLHNLEESEQHEAIDHLEEYLEQVEHKYENVRSFLPLVLTELRSLFSARRRNKK